MTGIREASDVNERALVKNMPDGFVRTLLPEVWPSNETGPSAHSAPVQPPAPKLRERLLSVPLIAREQIRTAIETEAGRGAFFLLLPVFAGIGAIIYFTLSFEPAWTPLLSMLGIAILLRVATRRHYVAAQCMAFAIALSAGLVVGKWETERRATPMLGSDVATRITGRVVALEYQDNGSWRITFDVLQTERPKLRFPPKRVRINARDIPASTSIGSGLTGFARLRIPSGPVRPGNYDFSFHAYFNGIGANGFFLGTPKVAAVSPPDELTAEISQWIAMLRVRVSERIEEVIGGEDGSVASALVAGTRAGISEKTNDDLRKAGLAHILSISGLHMALAAGVVMLTLRSLFALFPAFSVRHPVKKYAAFLSLLSCTFYLAMSGADVAAQRSYVMIAVMLGALLVDRAAISMRNLAIAALAMIAISPHEILGPSFQMSFSATAALIAGYAWWSECNARKYVGKERRGKPTHSFGGKILKPVTAAAGTSLIAGLASGIFAAYHFNNTAPLGLVGNVLAEPAIALLVMPFAVFGLVLMPLQLDWVPLQIMGWGIFAVRHIAAFVAAWSPDGNPGAMPALTLVLWTIALVLAVVLSTRMKALALPFIVLGFAAFVREPFPDIVVSEDAKLVGVRLTDGRFAVNRSRPSQFTVDNWKTAYLVEEFIAPPSGKNRKRTDVDGFECEDGLCTISLRDGRTLVYTADVAMQEIACNIGDVVILAVPGKEASCGRSTTLSISKRDLALKGSVEIRLGKAPEQNRAPEALSIVSPEATKVDVTQPIFDLQRDSRITFAINTPSRPWHMHRIHSRPARGLAEREYKPKPRPPKNAVNCSSGADRNANLCE
ncbi:ComEC/Rec2 family competence protein [Brucella oryzae]|uniref:ComEC/Rec2 family competence protein n=1 Tax=Brucella oryzae TaxID=335286 RepID=UPI001B81319D|nr:ComEC/Rec2 family competence protein [Brucella oryzae]MBR7652811.1 ComEC/Rec2 family competence protein [Brucella oryzae]